VRCSRVKSDSSDPKIFLSIGGPTRARRFGGLASIATEAALTDLQASTAALVCSRWLEQRKLADLSGNNTIIQ
jgi:hypothetical protein